MAREEACHWHGHGGYTGSVAEKNGIILIADRGPDLKARLDRAIKGIRDLQRRLREPGKKDIAEALLALQRGVGAYFEIDEFELRHGSKTSALKELQAEAARLGDLKKRCRAHMKPTEVAEVLLEIGDRRIRDKWGPAGCIDLTPRKKRDKEFLFFGWASC